MHSSRLRYAYYTGLNRKNQANHRSYELNKKLVLKILKEENIHCL